MKNPFSNPFSNPFASLSCSCCRRRPRTEKPKLEKALPNPNSLRARAGQFFTRKRKPELKLERRKVAPSFVTDLGVSHLIVDSKPSTGGRGRLVALATPPLTLNVSVPKGHQAGQRIYADGPHGRLCVDIPLDAEIGSTHQVRLGPPQEFRIGIPKGIKTGAEVDLIFKRPEDGLEIVVPIPAGLSAGDSFDVPPPSLMVKVPDGASPGDTVVFRPAESQGADEKQWLRARIPKVMTVGNYFTARLPPPDGLPKVEKKPEVVDANKKTEMLLSEVEWEEVTDPKTGEVYFWNKYTEQTSWTKPVIKKRTVSMDTPLVEKRAPKVVKEPEKIITQVLDSKSMDSSSSQARRRAKARDAKRGG